MSAVTPIVDRIPRTIDGCTWYAYSDQSAHGRIGATGRTKASALDNFAEQWERFGGAP